MARTQISPEPEVQSRVRQRAHDLGISMAEYVRRLVLKDMSGSLPKADPTLVFDLGRSSAPDIRRNKDAMIAEAFEKLRPRRSGRRSPTASR